MVSLVFAGCASNTRYNVPRCTRKANIRRPTPGPGSTLRSNTPRIPPALPTGGHGSNLVQHGCTIDVTPQPPAVGCNHAYHRNTRALEPDYRPARR